MGSLSCQARWLLGKAAAAKLPTFVPVRTHLGYIPFEGPLRPYPTNQKKFHGALKVVNLQPVNKITFAFDPFTDDHHSIRNFMYFLNAKSVKATNVKTLMKTSILDDRSAPIVTFDLNDGRQLEIKTGRLTELEIVTIVNHYVLPLVKEVEESVVETKSSKQMGKGAGKGKKR